MLVERVIPEGLAEMSPGPVLAAVLAGLDHGLVANDEVVVVLEAQSRQLAYEQARMFSVLNEVLHRVPSARPGQVRRGAGPGQFAADEVRAALAWSRRFADRETDLAFALVVGLPLVWQALLDGCIDRGKAAVFADHLLNLSGEQVEVICRRVVPVAGGLTPWQIGERIKRLILEIDPEYYLRRYRKAVRDRKLIGYLDAEGAAVVTGSGLPAEDAAAALERVDSLARAARRAGHPNTLDQLRADVFLGLLDGSLHGLPRDGIVAVLLGRVVVGPAEGSPAEQPGSGAGSGAAAGSGPGPAASGGGAVAACSPAAGGPDARSSGLGGPVADGPDVGDLDADGSDGDGPDSNGPDSACSGEAEPAVTPATVPGSVVPGSEQVGLEVRVGLATLLGFDERAGEIPGWGPVPATVARVVVARQRRAEWRWAVLDAQGRLVSEGITRRRPTGLTGAGVRGGVVELQIPETLLAGLVAEPARSGVWARVIADIAARHRDREGRVQDLDAHPEDRFPRAALRRHVQIRDRHCVFRGCRTPARKADQDHTVDHARGGPTTADDLGPACRHDHMLKTQGGWELRQPEPGVFVWISPLGRRYPVRPEPVLPPPVAPVAREPDPWHDRPADPVERPLNLGPGRRAPPPPPAPRARRRRPDWNAEHEEDIDDPPPF